MPINTVETKIYINYFLIIAVILFLFCFPISLCLDHIFKKATSYNFRIIKRALGYGIALIAIVLSIIGWLEKNAGMLLASLVMSIIGNLVLFINIPDREVLRNLNKDKKEF